MSGKKNPTYLQYQLYVLRVGVNHEGICSSTIQGQVGDYHRYW